ncbi:MAG: flagellin [Alphaproteobacteria bacterium]
MIGSENLATFGHDHHPASSTASISTVTAASAALAQANASLEIRTGFRGAHRWQRARRRSRFHQVFVEKLVSSLKGGIGNLVDADLAVESANLQALQVKQQLGVQSLSIANQRPQILLSLFRG